jgi:hypothetical protein
MRKAMEDLMKCKLEGNTKLSYMYRDANNYKEYREIVLEGLLTPEEVQIFMECLDKGCGADGGFIPNQVGLEDLQERLHDSKDWGDDHPWHEFISLEPTNEPADTDFGPIKELLKRFKAKKGKWDSAYGVPHILDKRG